MRPGRAADHSPPSSSAVMEEKSYTSTHSLGHNGPVKRSLYLYHYLYLFKNTNPLMAKDPYSGRTVPVTSKRCILYIYSTNTVTEYFKHGIYSPFFSSSKCSLFHNSNEFGSYFIHILYTGCAKIKKK